MESDWVLIRISAVVAAGVLPVISAFSLRRAIAKNWVLRYVRCLAAYMTAIILVYSGYLFQGLITEAPRLSNFYGGWRWIERIVAEHDYLSGSDTIVLISSIISFAVLFPRDHKSRIIAGFRTSFITFMTFDIIAGMTQGFAAEQYIMCAIFDLVGALLFGAVCAFCFQRLVPVPE